jgi:acetolactate decarboxylase
MFEERLAVRFVHSSSKETLRMIRFLILGVSLCGCAGSHDLVEQYGGMRDVLRLGNTQSRISFAEMRQQPHAIGVGALTDLQGEITIFDGQIFVATTSDGISASTTREDATPGSATLMTISHVKKWHHDTLPDSLPLEQAIETVARSHGIDSDTPFPFIIEGVAESYELHVINGFCPIATPDLAPEDQPWRAHGESTALKVIGFFARDQHGVMTHHGSNLHIHAIIGDGNETITGHLDAVEMAPGSVLSVPVVKNMES